MDTSLKKIASQMGVSHAAVSMALRNHPRISEDKRRQIQQLAKEMGYRPHLLARGLKTRKSQTVGLLIPNFATSATNLKVGRIEEALADQGYQILIGFTRGECKATLEYAINMQCRQVDALVIVGMSYMDLAREEYDRLLQEISKPFILIDCHLENNQLPGVYIDRAAGIERMGEYLYSLGHRDLMFICRGDYRHDLKWIGFTERLPRRWPTGTVRFRWASIYTKGWHELEESDRPAGEESGPDRNKVERAAYEKGREVAQWAEQPSAVLFPSDHMAMAFILGLTDGGLKVPDDISVSGFDDTDEVRFFRPALTTMRQPREELAEKALEILLRNLKGEAPDKLQEWLIPELVARNSTGERR